MSRRKALGAAGMLAGAAAVAEQSGVAAVLEPKTKQPSRPFLFCLNTATIRGQKLGIVKEVELIAKAGFDSIEPWVSAIEEYTKGGGDLNDLKKKIADSGLTVESAIGFPDWLVDDEVRRAKGLDRAKREMEMMVKLGAKRFAAPPAGATALPTIEISVAAERYRALLDAGEQLGVVPQLELWGFSKNMGQLGECIAVAMETGHRNACVLADIYHLYKGASAIEGIRLLGPSAIQVVHMNDYPADPPRDKIDDSFRVYPGDGVAPVAEALSLLRNKGQQTVLSLEVFNRKYWAEDAFEVLKTGLSKMKSVVEKLPA